MDSNNNNSSLKDLDLVNNYKKLFSYKEHETIF